MPAQLRLRSARKTAPERTGRFALQYKGHHHQDVVIWLKSWSKIRLCVRLLEESIPEGASSIWTVLVALSILSNEVDDIIYIFHLISHSPGNRITAYDLIDFFYSLALLFQHAQYTFDVNHGYHYRLYYALHVIENSGGAMMSQVSSPNKGQQSLMRYGLSSSSMSLTHEQLRIVSHSLGPGQVIKIVALAGTGKTTTLLKFAQAHPHLSFLLVVYNKSAQEYASKLFPQNVRCSTAHSLAYRAEGFKYRHKLTGDLKAKDIVSNHALRQRENAGNMFRRAGIVLETIKKFMCATDEIITMAHVPEVWTSSQDSLSQTSLSPEERVELAKDAEFTWECMTRTSHQLRLPHDAYLKLWQLHHPTLEQKDCILIDEGQDMNAAMLDVLMSQICPKIIVGDPNQQIYAFRGAINALKSVESTHTYYLTQSFRFGPNIGYLASCILEGLQGEKKQTLVGRRKKDSIQGFNWLQPRSLAREGQLAVLCRANYSVFFEAVRLLNLPALSRSAIAFIGGLECYSFQDAVDIWNLDRVKSGELSKDAIKNPFIRGFESRARLTAYAKSVQDAVLEGKIAVAIKFQENTEIHLNNMRRRCAQDPRHAGCQKNLVELDLPPISISQPKIHVTVRNRMNIIHPRLICPKCVAWSMKQPQIGQLPPDNFPSLFPLLFPNFKDGSNGDMEQDERRLCRIGKFCAEVSPVQLGSLDQLYQLDQWLNHEMACHEEVSFGLFANMQATHCLGRI
ncbi:unnamed protein product [Darwinula stevensoni]|uniref:DNA helicase n=1 Tax=Darwinula stevensoni TaxID=69355 RepID=A0A7R9A120_9CRUS|nr:unnamed protein product [Darwinula stevensoni]CAG0885657.1 unnamed protein product [Darwinula stevensoni]